MIQFSRDEMRGGVFTMCLDRAALMRSGIGQKRRTKCFRNNFI